TSQGHRILVDTGLGTKLSAREEQFWGLKRDGGLIDNLRRLGVAPEEVDMVVNTHLHADHCGSNTHYRNGSLVPTFPQAQYYIQKLEWEAATHPNEWSRYQYHEENFVPIAEAGLLHLLDGDAPLTSEVRCLLAKGHTPGHQCVVIESDGEWAVIIGDIAPMAPQVERVHWLSSFDMEPMVNMETKKRLLQEARARNGLIFLFHDPQVQAGRLVEQEGKVRLEKVD
ncbi:MAG: MBL fold metallo-hydrolase, partial [Dehalococcoidia bacterium]|nr:MBL fold metallo-hydrolase [Dehalococcoidia bacterium]